MPELHESTYSEAQFLMLASLIGKTAEVERQFPSLATNGNGRMPWKELATGGILVILAVIGFLGKEVYDIRGIQASRGSSVARIQPLEDSVHALEKDNAWLRSKLEEQERALIRVYDTLRQHNRVP